MEHNAGYIGLSDLQNIIQDRIGELEHWVKVEIETHRESGGHHYLNLIEKSSSGTITAKASGKIWRTNASVVSRFVRATGKSLDTGMSIVVKAHVDYHPVYGLSLIISDIDPSFTIGQRELERQETIRRLSADGAMERQKKLQLPFLPTSIAVISSQDAAGYGDFMKHLGTNPRGFVFNCTLFQALMQGERCPSSIAARVQEAAASGIYDLIVIMRGGGADSDLFGYDDYALCQTIAECRIPVFTAIGHERDYHIADMVAFQHFKTPTALADGLIDWYEAADSLVTEALDDIQDAFKERIASEEQKAESTLANIRFMLGSRLSLMENELSLLETRIKGADPREILRQGYLLATDGNGVVLKNASAGKPGDKVSVRFHDGRWDCNIEKVKIDN